jgi:NitT/TauT family transport system ATP-binding protein
MEEPSMAVTAVSERTREQHATSSGATAADLRVEGVSKAFESQRGRVEALRDVDLRVEAGQFAAFVGASGCGKSTLLRVIAGIHPATTGTVHLGGEQVTEPRRDIGMVFQSPNLMPWRDVESNVSLPLEVGGKPDAGARDRVDRYLKLVGLDEFRKRLPSELSGGMQQRAGIVRALVHDPGLLLMDEPFGAVDVMTRDRLNFEIQALWMQTHKTIVFVTHSIQEAVFLADVVFVFSPRPGTIVERIEVDLPRPRTRELIHTPEFFELEERVRLNVRES